MPREYAFETVGSAAFPGLPTTTDPFDYTDTLYNLLESGEYKVGEYPDTMFWGGVDRTDAPYMYPACITFDYEYNTLSINALQGNTYDGVYKDDVQLSYAYTIKDNSSYGDFMALPNDWTVAINDNDQDILSWDLYKSYVTGMDTTANNSRFVSKVALNRRIIIPYLWFCPKTAWNAAITGSPSEPDTVLDLCSCAEWETGTVSYTNRETNTTSTVSTSDCIICGVKIMQCGAIRDFGSDGGIRMLGRPSDKFRSIYDATKVSNPINSLFYNYNHDAVLDYGNLHCASVQIPLAAEDYPYSIGGNSDTTSYTFYLKSYLNNLYMGDLGGFWSYYIDPPYQWHKSGKNAAAPMIYNGNQSFDISEIMAFSSAGMYRRAYVDGDSYIISTQTFTNTYRTYQYNTKITIRPVYRSLDDLYKFVAGLGMAFMIGNIYTSSTTVNKTILDDSIFAPVLDEHNVYHGEYTRGADNADNDFFDKSDSTDTDYIPQSEPAETGDNIGDDIIRPTSLGAGGTLGFVTQYALRKDDLTELGDLLWTSIFDADYWKNYMFSLALDTGSFDLASILNFFISLRVYPFPLVNVPSYAAFGNNMYIGTGIRPLTFTNNIHVINDYVDYVPGGSAIIDSDNFFHDWRDYVNTEIILYIPYCGTIHLNPADVVGNEIFVQYAVDFATGGCIAYVDLHARGGKRYTIGALPGQIGADIPLTATAAGQVAARLAGDAMNIAGLFGDSASREIGTATGALKGNFTPSAGSIGFALGGPIGAAAGSAIGMAPSAAATAIGMLSRSGVQAPMLGGARGFASFGAPQTPYVQIRRGIYPSIDNYSQVVGNPAPEAVYISDCSGLISGDIITAGLAVQADEAAAIRAAVSNGIIV